jgi:hypothetical protein
MFLSLSIVSMLENHEYLLFILYCLDAVARHRMLEQVVFVSQTPQRISPYFHQKDDSPSSTHISLHCSYPLFEQPHLQITASPQPAPCVKLSHLHHSPGQQPNIPKLIKNNHHHKRKQPRPTIPKTPKFNPPSQKHRVEILYVQYVS